LPDPRELVVFGDERLKVGQASLDLAADIVHDGH
jgi:hypothetical protein